MKTVLILFGKSNWERALPFSSEAFQASYECLYSLAKKNNIQMYRASCLWYDYDKHVFKYAWTYEDETGWTRAFNIQPDLIYDKTGADMEIYYRKELIAKHYRFVNSLRFTHMLDNKLITSMIFHKWSKKSWIVNNPEKLKNILPKIRSRKFVIKPISESGGRDVQILRKEEALEKVTFSNDYIIQEFIDSSSGVPGISENIHDLRLVFVNDKISYAYIREPAEGNYLANLSQGGSLSIVPTDSIPRSLYPIIRCANRVFETFNPRVYSIDFMFDENKKPWIVELNSMPGLYFTPQEKPHMLKLYDELIAIFLKKLEMSTNK
ncbi:MAG: ATP-grasp domain-containing protein [Candidatus Moraniibacteriota bacterium]